MKKLKSLIASYLALTLTFSLAACSNKLSAPGSEVKNSETAIEETTATAAITTIAVPSAEPEVDWNKASNPSSLLNPASESDFEYKYDADLAGIAVNKYIGNNISVMIPDTIENEPVVKIAAYAFADNKNIEYVYFPDTVTKISGLAFKNCKSLTLIIPERATILDDNVSPTVKNLAFTSNSVGLNNSNYLPFFQELADGSKEYPVDNIKYKDKTYSLNNDKRVEKVSELYKIITGGDFNTDVEASKNWTYEHVRHIIDYTDESFDIEGVAITGYISKSDKIRITVPAEVEGQPVVCLGSYTGESKSTAEVFSNSSGIIDVAIPDSVKIIGVYAFNNLKTLKTVNIPNNIIVICKNAFADTAITELKLPKALKEIGSEAFSNIPITELTLPDSLAEIENSVFSGCKNLATINIPSSIVKIGNSAFYGTAITKLMLSNGLEEIGDSAFAKCEGLAILNIPDSVYAIGRQIYSGKTVANYKNKTYESDTNSYKELSHAING